MQNLAQRFQRKNKIVNRKVNEIRTQYSDAKIFVQIQDIRTKENIYLVTNQGIAIKLYLLMLNSAKDCQSQLDKEFQYAQRILKPQGDPTPLQMDEEFCTQLEQDDKKILKINAFDDPYYQSANSPSKSYSLKTVMAQITEQYLAERKDMKQKQKMRLSGGISESQFSKDRVGLHDHEDSRTQSNNSKTKGIRKQQYPTKNFLPSFRSSFLNFLSPNFKNKQFEEFQIIKRIRSKDCINLQDYEDLFRVKQFLPLLKTYFRNKVIVRDLMQSRIDYKTKRNYLTRIHVFEKAFQTGVFNKIN